MNWKTSLKNATFAAALAGGLLLVGGAQPARADDDMGACHRNIDKWQDRLNHDIDRHGAESHQAKHDREELDETRDACRHRYGDKWRDEDRRDDHHDDHHDDHDNNNHY